MASSGLIQGTVTQRLDRFRSWIYWRRLGEEDIPNNRTQVHIEVLVDSLYQASSWQGSGASRSLTVDGTNINTGAFTTDSYTSWDYNPTTSPTGRYAEIIYSMDIWIVHDPDGSKTFSFSTSDVMPVGTYGPGTVTVNGTGVLDTLPRTSLINSFADFQIETTAGAINGNLTIYSTTFNHTVQLLQNGIERASWAIANGLSGSYNYVLSLTQAQRDAIFAAMSTAEAQAFSLIVTTFSGTTPIGSAQTAVATGTIPAGYIPTFAIAGGTFRIANKNDPVAMRAFVIKNISTLFANMSGGAAVAAASLANYQIRFEGIVRTGAYTGAAIAEQNMGLTGNPGVISIYYSVKDSRGRWSTEVSKSITVLDYSPPVSQGFDVTRNSAVPTSVDFILKFSNSLYAQGNTWSYIPYYWNDLAVPPAWTACKASTAISAAAIDSIYTYARVPVFSESLVYDMKIIVTDLFNSAEYADTLPTTAFILAYGKKGIGAGKDTSDVYNVEVGALGLSSDGPIMMKNQAGVLTSLINLLYPVNQVIFSISPTNPGTYIPGTTWVAFGTGRTIVGVDTTQTEFNTVQKTGGEKAHVLTNGELPANSFAGAGTAQHGTSGSYPTYWMFNENSVISGGGLAHNTLPPYITLYMWKRTA